MPLPRYTLHISNVSHHTQLIDLEDEFSFYGPIVRVDKPRGKKFAIIQQIVALLFSFAFVEYKHSTDAERALAGMDGEKVNGFQLRLNCYFKQAYLIRIDWARERRGFKDRARSRSRLLLVQLFDFFSRVRQEARNRSRGRRRSPSSGSRGRSSSEDDRSRSPSRSGKSQSPSVRKHRKQRCSSSGSRLDSFLFSIKYQV